MVTHMGAVERQGRGRPDARLREILAELRGRIHRGEWKPGGRLPTRRGLAAAFGASPMTIQQALDDLEADGFTRSDGRNGTFLVETPPHLVNVALVFAADPSKNRFWLALFREAMKERSDELRITPRCGINVNGVSDNPDQAGLVSDIQRRRLYGVFFASTPFQVDKTPIVTEPGIPRCAVMSPGAYHEMPKIGFDGGSLKRKALDFLKAKGRSRVAVIGDPGVVGSDWLERIEERGLASGPHWLQGVGLTDTLPGANLARLLLRGRPGERPDGLVIVNDNLVESVTAGLSELGLDIPRELDIVAHCNFPCVPPSAVPVTRLGYEVGEVLEAGMRALRAIRSGEPPDPYVAVEALFEDEAPRRPVNIKTVTAERRAAVASLPAKHAKHAKST